MTIGGRRYKYINKEQKIKPFRALVKDRIVRFV